MKLAGKVAAVTGAAKGIGRCIATEMAQEGAKVCILDFDREAGRETQNQLRAAGWDAFFIETDVSRLDSLKYAKGEIDKTYGAVDILVVNAGISIKHTVDEISEDEWNRVIDINLTGSFYTCKAFYTDFKTKTPADGGRIIFITSGSAITGTGGGIHYAATKAGQHGLMRALAKELGPNGVNVNAIAPRVIVTDIFDMLYPTDESRQTLLSQIPIGRLGYPEDIAHMAVFLAGEEASYIHSQIILMDGGRTY